MLKDHHPHGSCLDRKVVVVGASLAGLTFALACANRGLPTRILERVCGKHQGGGALGIDKHLLVRVVGVDPPLEGRGARFPTITGYRHAVAWHAIHGWLLGQVSQRDGIELMTGTTVSKVHQSASSATAVTTEGDKIQAEVIVGADGYRSVVRPAVNPNRHGNSYAGYLLWRGLIPEVDLPSKLKLPVTTQGDALINNAGYRLVAYPVAGMEGSLEPGKRLISFAWYDPFRVALLREFGCLSKSAEVQASLAAKNVPLDTRNDLLGLAARIWPDPWRTVIQHALERREVFATPISEYLPDRLHRGRLAIIGDAAHVVSPVTGKGFVSGILDAESLANCLASASGKKGTEIPSALEDYAAKRLSAVRTLVATSVEWSRAYLRGIPRASATEAEI